MQINQDHVQEQHNLLAASVICKYCMKEGLNEMLNTFSVSVRP